MLKVQTKDLSFHIINEPSDMSSDDYIALAKLIEKTGRAQFKDIVIYKVARVFGHRQLKGVIEWAKLEDWLKTLDDDLVEVLISDPDIQKLVLVGF